MLIEEVIKNDWYQQAIATEVKIKAFFGMTAANQRKLIQTATAIEDQLNLPCGSGGDDDDGGGTNNDDGGGRGDIDDGRDGGGINDAMNELDAALHQAVENEVDVLQRMEEENADVFRLEDEVSVSNSHDSAGIIL